MTDAVLEHVKAWQTRPLEAVHPVVYLDAIHVKLRYQGHVQTQAVYLALALTMEGENELLGLRVGEAEGAKFWLSVLSELKNRGVRDILIASARDPEGHVHHERHRGDQRPAPEGHPQAGSVSPRRGEEGALSGDHEGE